MQWKKQVADSPAAQEILAHAKAKSNTLRTLVVADVDHAIVTWVNKRRVWEYWQQDPGTTDWSLVGAYPSAAAAKVVAQARATESVAAPVVPLAEDAPVILTAEWVEPYSGPRPLIVRCSSPKIGEEIATVFRHLGCIASLALDKGLDAEPVRV